MVRYHHSSTFIAPFDFRLLNQFVYQPQEYGIDLSIGCYSSFSNHPCYYAGWIGLRLAVRVLLCVFCWVFRV